MKVKIVTEKVLESPVLSIRLDLSNGLSNIDLEYTCARCSGYGCHNKPCDSRVKLTPKEILSTLGPEGEAKLRKLFDEIFGPIL